MDLSKVICPICCLLVLSCSEPALGVLEVDCKKALRHKVPAQEIYSRVEVLPLCLPDTTSIPDNPDIDVCDNMLFVLDELREHLIVCNLDGSFITLLGGAGKPISDYSVFKNQYLDILYDNIVEEYDLRNFDFVEEIRLSTEGVAFSGMARSDENALEFAGFKGETAYDCGFDISRHYYYEVSNPRFKAEEYEEGKFFRYNDYPTFFVCKSGIINEYTPDDFIHPYLIPVLEDDSSIATNAQMSSSHIYIQFRLNETDAVLICNRGEKEYRLFHHTADGLEFPIGIIYRDVNYYCCPTSCLKNYVEYGSLDESILSRYVLIKYYL